MRHLARGRDLYAQGSFGGNRDLVLSGFAVDQEMAAERVFIGDLGALAVTLLADENRWVNGQRIEVSGGMAL